PRARRRAPRSSRAHSPSVLAVHLLDEAGELVRGAADGAQRLLVVHAQWAEQADGAERLVREAVRRADERQVTHPGLLELFTDTRERPAGVEPAREPSLTPASRSLRYSDAHVTRPGSSGSANE